MKSSSVSMVECRYKIDYVSAAAAIEFRNIIYDHRQNLILVLGSSEGFVITFPLSLFFLLLSAPADMKFLAYNSITTRN